MAKKPKIAKTNQAPANNIPCAIPSTLNIDPIETKNAGEIMNAMPTNSARAITQHSEMGSPDPHRHGRGRVKWEYAPTASIPIKTTQSAPVQSSNHIVLLKSSPTAKTPKDNRTHSRCRQQIRYDSPDPQPQSLPSLLLTQVVNPAMISG